MKTRQDVLDRMTALHACTDAFNWFHAQPADKTLEQMWEVCPNEFKIWFTRRNHTKEAYDLFIAAHGAIDHLDRAEFYTGTPSSAYAEAVQRSAKARRDAFGHTTPLIVSFDKLWKTP